jgi:hypothetical protein
MLQKELHIATKVLNLCLNTLSNILGIVSLEGDRFQKPAKQ